MTEVCKIHGNILINECYQCGAPVCCPSCCNEATRQPEAEQSAGKERKPAVTQWLSDDEIGCLEFQSVYSKQLFEQAKEANRLRAGLEEIRNHAIKMRNKNAENYDRTLDPPYSDAEQIFEGFADDIGELLEGEK